MRLLVVTQAIDTEDPVLGFFHQWIAALAGRVERIEAVCLREGKHALPESVSVHSLGKEHGRKSRMLYALRFLMLAWKLRKRYDAVFVHMNEEYVLLAGWFWRLSGKRVYMWRNHYAGSWRTKLAALFCTKVFCTSKHSYTARFRRTVLMPVGVDAERFLKQDPKPEPRSILFLARMSPSKRPDLVLDALGELLARGESFTADFVGSPLPVDERYYQSLKLRAEELGLHDRVRFLSGVPHTSTPTLFASHEYFINASPSGMFDKTIFEAAASGSIVLAASDDFRDAAGDDYHFEDAASLCDRLIVLMAEETDDRIRRRIQLQALARGESLQTLADQLAIELVR